MQDEENGIRVKLNGDLEINLYSRNNIHMLRVLGGGYTFWSILKGFPMFYNYLLCNALDLVKSGLFKWSQKGRSVE